MTERAQTYICIISLGLCHYYMDLKSETSMDSKTRLYQIIHTIDNVFLIVELAITRSKMGLETSFFLNDQQNALNNMLCQTQFSFLT